MRIDDLPAVYDALAAVGLADANVGLVTDIIACPGLDYCALANARSIPIAQRISERFADAARQHEIGELKIKISGCINACGHHHVGHIGILGVEKRGEEHYQLTLGGSGDEDAALGQIIGPGFGPDGIVDAVEKVVDDLLGAAQRCAASRSSPPTAASARLPSRKPSMPPLDDANLTLARFPLLLGVSHGQRAERTTPGALDATALAGGAFHRDAWVRPADGEALPVAPAIVSQEALARGA